MGSTTIPASEAAALTQIAEQPDMPESRYKTIYESLKTAQSRRLAAKLRDPISEEVAASGSRRHAVKDLSRIRQLYWKG